MPLGSQLSLAFVTIFILPAILGLGVFFIALRHWAVQILRDDENFRERVHLASIENGVSWQLDLNAEEIPWPSNPLEWATVAALSLILFETAAFGRSEPETRMYWYAAGVVGATAALAVPFAASVIGVGRILGLAKRQLLALLAPSNHLEVELIQEISEIGRDIRGCFAAIAMKSRIDPGKNCRDVLFLRVKKPSDTERQLGAVRKTVAAYLEELRSWMPIHEAALQEFEWAKNAVIGNGSATLLGELDRLKECMISPRLAGLLDRGRWDKAHQFLNQVRFDLRMVQNAAEGGSDMPLSLGDAYRLLNVNSRTSNKVIKGVVDALRRVWHPDLISDDAERERRTAKMKQINAAWEIVLEARSESSEFSPADGDRAASILLLN